MSPHPTCELCGSPAVSFCVPDSAFLCAPCDLSSHSANFLLARHARARLCQHCHSPLLPAMPADPSCQNCSSLAPNPNQIDRLPCSNAPPNNKRTREDEGGGDNQVYEDKDTGRVNAGVGKMESKVGAYNELSDSESYHNGKLKVRTHRKRAHVLKISTPPPARPFTAATMNAWDEYKEQEVLRKWHSASGMVSEFTVPLAVHLLERLGRPWLLITCPSIPGMATRMQVTCLAGCLWVAARLTETPTALDQAWMLLPKCTGVPHNHLTVAEARLWKLFHWQTGIEEHATSL